MQKYKRKFSKVMIFAASGLFMSSGALYVTQAGAATPAPKHIAGKSYVSEAKKSVKKGTTEKKKSKSSNTQSISELAKIISLTHKKVNTEKSVVVKIGASFAINKGAILEHSDGNIATSGGELQDYIIVNKKKGNLTQILSNKVAYCKGNTLGLEYGCGLTPAQANKANNRWVAIPDTKKNSSLYVSAAGDMTIGAAFKSLFPSSLTSYHLGKNLVINKVNSYAIVGTVPGSVSSTLPKGISEDFYVAADGTYLPERVELTTKGVGELVDFSKWDHAKVPAAPKQSVNISKL